MGKVNFAAGRVIGKSREVGPRPSSAANTAASRVTEKSKQVGPKPTAATSITENRKFRSDRVDDRKMVKNFKDAYVNTNKQTEEG